MNFDQASSWPVSRLRIWHLREVIVGTGVLEWSPINGWTLYGQIKRMSRRLRDSTVSSVGSPVVRRTSVIVMKFTSHSNRIGYTRRWVDIDDIGMMIHGSSWFKVWPRWVEFQDRYSQRSGDTDIRTELVLKTYGSIRLPHDLNVHETIDVSRVSGRWSRDAIDASRGEFKLIGRKLGGDEYWFQCCQPEPHSHRAQIHLLPQAIELAMTFLSLRPCVTIRRLVRAGQIERSCARIPLESLDSLMSSGFIPWSESIDAECFRNLVRFLSTESSEAYVARRLINQIGFQTPQMFNEFAINLAITTALEGACRGLEGVVGGKGSKKFSPKNSLMSFLRVHRLHYSSVWRDIVEEVCRAWDDLRQLEAHPSWIERYEAEDQSIDLSRDSLEKRDILVRWYGFMILIMAGMTPESPRLP